MKREGRQHGMVRTYRILPSPLNPRPDNRYVNKFDSPSTCGSFTIAPSKPTNHSKFTGKCGKPRCTECHMNPAGKSKVKTKGSEKLNPLSSGLVSANSNYKLITWRVVDGRHGSNYSGFSATGMLNHLARNDDDDYEDDGDEVDDYANYGYDQYGSYDQEQDVDATIEECSSPRESTVVIERVVDTDCVLDDADADDENDDDDEEEERNTVMSFCDVGMVFDEVEGDDSDEGWCLVGQT